MEAMTVVLDKVTKAIERILDVARPTTKTASMTPEAFVDYAIEQIRKAATEEADKAERRLRALGRTVQAAKQAWVDTESETIKVPVYEEQTTAAADESEKEIAPAAAAAGAGDSTFAYNAKDLHKMLGRIAKELEALRSEPAAEPATGEKVEKAEEDVVWPFDMNTAEFRGGVKKTEAQSVWGEDPKGLRADEAS